MVDHQDRLVIYKVATKMQARIAGLSWQTDGGLIQTIAGDVNAVREALALPNFHDGSAVRGTYWGGEELGGTWMAGKVEPWDFARHTLDFLAQELAPNTFAQFGNLSGLVAAFGPAIVDPLFDLVVDMLPDLRTEYQRLVTTENGIEIYASATETEDGRFDEACLFKCDADAEGATLITIADLDKDDFASLGEFVEERNAAAVRAMRGEAELIEVARDVDGRVLMCTGCGTVEKLDSLLRRMPKALSCCPERKMSPAVLGEDIAGGQYLVWSNEHSAWWGRDRRGYTRIVANAGRYSREDALGIAGTRDGGWHARKGNPDEIAIPERDAIDQYAEITRAQDAEAAAIAARKGEQS